MGVLAIRTTYVDHDWRTCRHRHRFVHDVLLVPLLLSCQEFQLRLSMQTDDPNDKPLDIVLNASKYIPQQHFCMLPAVPVS